MWTTTQFVAVLSMLVLQSVVADLDPEAQKISEVIHATIAKLSQNEGMTGLELGEVAFQISADIDAYLTEKKADVDEKVIADLLSTLIPDDDGKTLLTSLFDNIISREGVKLEAALILWDKLAELLTQVEGSETYTLYTVLAALDLTSQAIAENAALTEEVYTMLAAEQDKDQQVSTAGKLDEERRDFLDLHFHGKRDEERRDFLDLHFHGKREETEDASVDKRFWDMHCSLGKRDDGEEDRRTPCHFDRSTTSDKRDFGDLHIHIGKRDVAQIKRFGDLHIHFGKRGAPTAEDVKRDFGDLHIHIGKREGSMTKRLIGVYIHGKRNTVAKRLIGVYIHG